MSTTKLFPLNLPPGINKDTTEYGAEPGWVECDKIRFKDRKPESIGGWELESVFQFENPTNKKFTGVARDVHAWNDLDLQKYLAVGTHKKLELFTQGRIFDITPIREDKSFTDVISTTNGSSIVSIEDQDQNHNLTVGDYIYVNSQGSAVDGITLNGSYQVFNVIDSDNFQIDAGTQATGTTSSAGGVLDIEYLLENGFQNNGDKTGYSGGTYNTPGLSPNETSVTLTNAISTANGSNTLTINDTAHGLSVNEFITVVSQGSAVDGIDLSDTSTFSQDFRVQSVIDANNYTIKAINNLDFTEVTATGTTSGGGGTLELVYKYTGWNKPRAGVGGVDLRQWSLDNWGEDLIACVRKGKIYQWDATNGQEVRAVELANAPTENYFVMVAQPSRFLIAFGSQESATGNFDPLLVRWAEQETLANWTQTETNTAGEYRLPLGNRIVTAVQTRSEILIMTDTAVYTMRFVGGSQVFQFEIVSPNSGAISQHCGVDVNGTIYWMGESTFYMYDGVVRVLESKIEKFLFDLENDVGIINFSQKDKTYCEINKAFDEVWWLYQNSDTGDIDRYVVYNYADNLWYYGTIKRTVWQDSTTFSSPYAIADDGTLYSHEIGTDAASQPMNAYIRSSYLDLEDGEKFMFVDKIIPDVRMPNNRNATITCFFKKYPNSVAVQKGPFSFSNKTRKISLRGRGRQMSVEFRSNVTGGSIELGKVRFSAQPDGER